MTVITPISLSADWSVTVWVLAPPTQYMPGRHQVAVSSSRGVYTWGGGGREIRVNTCVSTIMLV